MLISEAKSYKVELIDHNSKSKFRKYQNVKDELLTHL